MPAPGQCAIKLNPYRAHFVTEEQKTQVHLWTLHELVHLKRPMGIIQDRATHGRRSCKFLEGGQLNKGKGGKESKEVRRGGWEGEGRKGK